MHRYLPRKYKHNNNNNNSEQSLSMSSSSSLHSKKRIRITVTRLRIILWILFAIIEIFFLQSAYKSLLHSSNTNIYRHSSTTTSSTTTVRTQTNNHYKSILDSTSTSRNAVPSTHITLPTSQDNITYISRQYPPYYTLPNDIPNPNSLNILPERGYPIQTHYDDYSTSATQLEIQKHDRMLIQSMVYMNQITSSTAAKTLLHQLYTPSKAQKAQQKICLNLYLCNRRIPYINSLITSLLSHSSDHDRDIFLSTAQVHLLNTEKRPNRMYFPYMEQTLSQLPFIHQVHNITYPDTIYENVAKERELDFREQFISDEISGLKICIESGLPYCVMMEEDSVVTVDFMTHLLEQVIQPLESQQQANTTANISVVSLYDYYNLVFFGNERLQKPLYAKKRYHTDRSKLNSERFSENLPPYIPIYHVREKDYKYGTVAMMYTRQSAIQLVKYLSQVGVNPQHNADEFMNSNEYFPKVVGIPRMSVEPSLVNHIGYYSERMANVKSRGMFSQLNTDSRFMFDAGVVWDE